MKNNWLDKYIPEAQNGIEGTMGGLTDKGFNYNGAWGGPSMQIGGSIPGTVGFTYARTNSPAPSKGPYAKKTMASAQNGQEMKFYQEGLDWKPKTISQWGGDYPLDIDQSIVALESIGKALEAPQKGIVNTLTGKYQYPSEAMGIKNPLGASLVDLILDPLSGGILKSGIKTTTKGVSKMLPKLNKLKNTKLVPKASLSKYEEGGVIEDSMGQWAHPGEITRIPSNQITMQGVPYNVLGISDTGDTQMMYPNQDYSFEGSSVTEVPIMQEGGTLAINKTIIAPEQWTKALSQVEKKDGSIGMWGNPIDSTKLIKINSKQPIANTDHRGLRSGQYYQGSPQTSKLIELKEKQLKAQSSRNYYKEGGWLSKYN